MSVVRVYANRKDGQAMTTERAGQNAKENVSAPCTPMPIGTPNITLSRRDARHLRQWNPTQNRHDAEHPRQRDGGRNALSIKRPTRHLARTITGTAPPYRSEDRHYAGTVVPNRSPRPTAEHRERRRHQHQTARPSQTGSLQHKYKTHSHEDCYTYVLWQTERAAWQRRPPAC